jgi:hypothetical protein
VWYAESDTRELHKVVHVDLLERAAEDPLSSQFLMDAQTMAGANPVREQPVLERVRGGSHIAGEKCKGTG